MITPEGVLCCYSYAVLQRFKSVVATICTCLALLMFCCVRGAALLLVDTAVL